MKRTKYIFHLLLALCVGFVPVACGDDDENETGDIGGVVINASLSAPEVTDITYSQATVSATFSGSSVGVLKRGFCYAATDEPTINDNVVEGSSYNAVLAGLEAGTTYYVRAYAYGSENVVYSEATSFSTLERTSEEVLADWLAPDYDDNYTSISGWSNRSKWNLANVHDPTVMKADDGYYYMYQTDASYGNAHEAGGHFHGRRSKDLINWEYLGGTMRTAPLWIKDSLNAIRGRMGLAEIKNPTYAYWAPCARKVKDGLYRMYYSVVVDNYIKTGAANNTANFDNSWTERAFIGVMETSDPASNIWEDKGYVITNASDKGLNWARTSVNDWNAYFRFNCIDPCYIITPENEHWLIYGSWHNGLAAVQLNPETGMTLNALPEKWGTASDIAPYGVRVAGRLATTGNYWSRWQGSEGPEVVYHDGWYYLFMAYDGLDVPYHTRVVRSRNITGPYCGIDGTNVTNGGTAYPIVTHPYKFSEGYGWVGISHCAIFEDGEGNWYYCSQARFPGGIDGINESNALMMGHVRSIRWTSSGWPVVMPERYAGVPQVEIVEDDLVGTWEHIDLSYQEGVQKTSTEMTFTADHKITSGPWKNGTWSFNAETNTLTANGVELLVQRECDWEAFPRHHTIVYAGINGTKTYWGKKK